MLYLPITTSVCVYTLPQGKVFKIKDFQQAEHQEASGQGPGSRGGSLAGGGEVLRSPWRPPPSGTGNSWVLLLNVGSGLWQEVPVLSCTLAASVPPRAPSVTHACAARPCAKPRPLPPQKKDFYLKKSKDINCQHFKQKFSFSPLLLKEQNIGHLHQVGPHHLREPSDAPLPKSSVCPASSPPPPR